uniref:Flavin-containing monooxygenase n=1 Tax=Vombatus ursinus TaxID=29139 RepID=A0A4X2JVI0_VOMUR
MPYSVYKSRTCISSKEMTAYSDYPFPDHYPNSFHNSKIMKYLWLYVKHFDLLKYVHFLVCSVRKHSDFSSTGQWDVVVDANGKQESYVFDAIVVCSGYYNDPYFPLETFPGNPEKFLGKKILVVGIGNSGADVASELSCAAKQVFLSTRRGAWIWNCVWDNGNPMDTVLFTRFHSIINRMLTASMINKWAENKLNALFNHDVYGLQPKHRFLSHQATLSDELPNHIITGRLQVKPNVKEFTKSAVIFEDGSQARIDVVIFATGYTFNFSFLEGNSEVLDSQCSVFKFVFPPQLEKPMLALVGIVQPIGATLTVSELQSQWATRVFKGLNKLPSASDMMIFSFFPSGSRFLKSPRDIRRVPFIDYMDQIASEIKVKPNLLSLFLWDPKLAFEVFFGPCTPYQYRLQGPGKWNGARRAILTQRERIIKPLRTQVISNGQPPFYRYLWHIGICVSTLFFLIFIIKV